MGRRIGSTSKKILKVSSLVGGTQLATMISTIIRTKLTAIWLGEVGVGLFGLLNTTVEFVSTLTQMGIRSSSVRSVSCEAERGNGEAVKRIVAVVRRWGWLLGLGGALIMVALAPLLAVNTFGDASHVWPYLLLALVVFLNASSQVEQAVLQGLQRFSALVRAMIWGVTIGCLASVPMLYYWGVDSVAPVILIYSVVTFIATWACRASVDKPEGGLSFRQTVAAGGEFMRLGFYMTVTGALGWGVGYLLLTYINHCAGLAEMGEYQAGYTLSMRYVSFAFAAFGMEYYPRLSAASTHGSRRIEVFMRHEMGLLFPLFLVVGLLMMVFAPWIVELFYSSKFVRTAPMIMLAAPSLVVRTMSWCVAFVILAKGDGPTYMVCETASEVLGMVLSIVGYNLGGLPGIGFNYVVWYLIYFVAVAIVVRRRYDVRCGVRQWWLTIIATLVLTVMALGQYLLLIMAL